MVEVDTSDNPSPLEIEIKKLSQELYKKELIKEKYDKELQGLRQKLEVLNKQLKEQGSQAQESSTVYKDCLEKLQLAQKEKNECEKQLETLRKNNEVWIKEFAPKALVQKLKKINKEIKALRQRRLEIKSDKEKLEEANKIREKSLNEELKASEHNFRKINDIMASQNEQLRILTKENDEQISKISSNKDAVEKINDIIYEFDKKIMTQESIISKASILIEISLAKMANSAAKPNDKKDSIIDQKRLYSPSSKIINQDLDDLNKKLTDLDLKLINAMKESGVEDINKVSSLIANTKNKIISLKDKLENSNVFLLGRDGISQMKKITLNNSCQELEAKLEKLNQVKQIQDEIILTEDAIKNFISQPKKPSPPPISEQVFSMESLDYYEDNPKALNEIKAKVNNILLDLREKMRKLIAQKEDHLTRIANFKDMSLEIKRLQDKVNEIKIDADLAKKELDSLKDYVSKQKEEMKQNIKEIIEKENRISSDLSLKKTERSKHKELNADCSKINEKIASNEKIINDCNDQLESMKNASKDICERITQEIGVISKEIERAQKNINNLEIDKAKKVLERKRTELQLFLNEIVVIQKKESEGSQD